jgi:hypothetical protein
MIKLLLNMMILLFFSLPMLAIKSDKTDKKRSTLKTARYVKVRHDALNQEEDEVKESCPPCTCICSKNSNN